MNLFAQYFHAGIVSSYCKKEKSKDGKRKKKSPL